MGGWVGWVGWVLGIVAVVVLGVIVLSILFDSFLPLTSHYFIRPLIHVLFRSFNYPFLHLSMYVSIPSFIHVIHSIIQCYLRKC